MNFSWKELRFKCGNLSGGINMDLISRFQGALIGTFVGDALGMPLEGLTVAEIRKKFGEVREMLEGRLGRGTYTDDTEMMLATAESLCRARGFDGGDMALSILENFHRERGYGKGTQRVLELLRSGVSWELAGEEVFPGGSFGNGAAMRIAPVGCFFYDQPQKLKEVALAAARITHTHRLGYQGAVLQARAVAGVLRVEPGKELDGENFLAELDSFLGPEAPEYGEALGKVRKLLKASPSTGTVAAVLGNDSRALYSVPAAIYSFLKHKENFEEVVVRAVLLGGDTDTIGSMAGALAGAYRGYQAVPRRWWEVLENGPKGRDYIVGLAEKLWQVKQASTK